MKRAGGNRPLLLATLPLAGFLLSGCLEPGASAVSASATATEPATGPARPAAVAATPDRTYLKLGAALLAADEPRQAYDAFMASIRVEGLSAEALIGAGIASERQGLLTAARRHFEKALELDAESLAANNNLGVVLLRLKEYYLARDAFRVAFALSSGRSEIAERNLARAEMAVALIEEAEKADPAVSHRVVRLGTSEFRITPLAESPAEMIGAQ